MSKRWSPLLGAIPAKNGTRFTVWSPAKKSAASHTIELALQDSRIFPLQEESNGLWSGFLPDVLPGALYRYRMDGMDAFPDPASRFQPHGVHGPSQVISVDDFAWSDENWRGISMRRLSIYELHVGTFTPEGTFEGVRKKLPFVAELGATAIELMPVADFPGRWNWGYDGAALFAPARCYGTPDDLRRLVNDAHAIGLAVILDVVYNHFGPDGAYTVCYSPYYFSERHKTPWGEAVNFDGEHSEGVRRHFVENALHWIHEYHMDGLRLDATHSMNDDSAKHFVAELAAAVRDTVTHREVVLMAEDHRNISSIVMPAENSGWGLDGVWSDDFHHEMRRLLAGDSDGYYQDFRGSTEDLAEIVQRGWLFKGRYSKYFREHRGTDPSGISPERFVFFLQNHDQIGNRARGKRLHQDITVPVLRAATCLLLLASQTPLLFMGQEWGAGSPFLYFTDHEKELGDRVRAGRRREYERFAGLKDTSRSERIADPQAESSFLQSRLSWEEPFQLQHSSLLRLHQALLRLRNTHPAWKNPHWIVEVSGDSALLLNQDRSGWRVQVIVLLKDPGKALEIDPRGEVLLSTEDAQFAPDPEPPEIDKQKRTILFHRPGALVLAEHADLA